VEKLADTLWISDNLITNMRGYISIALNRDFISCGEIADF